MGAPAHVLDGYYLAITILVTVGYQLSGFAIAWTLQVCCRAAAYNVLVDVALHPVSDAPHIVRQNHRLHWWLELLYSRYSIPCLGCSQSQTSLLETSLSPPHSLAGTRVQCKEYTRKRVCDGLGDPSRRYMLTFRLGLRYESLTKVLH